MPRKALIEELVHERLEVLHALPSALRAARLEPKLPKLALAPPTVSETRSSRSSTCLGEARAPPSGTS